MTFAELAVTAGKALVKALVTDGKERVRQRVARLFGHGEPGPAAERRLDVTRGELMPAPEAERARLQEDLGRRVRFADQPADHSDAEPEVAGLVEELQQVTAARVDHSSAAGPGRGDPGGPWQGRGRRYPWESGDTGQSAAMVIEAAIPVDAGLPGSWLAYDSCCRRPGPSWT
jgi:hypothetical protein